MDTQQIQVAPAPPIPKLALTIKEAEYSLGVSKRTLNRLIADGQTRSVLVRVCRLIPASELWQKLKIDRQIIAIAKVRQATELYTCDQDLAAMARAEGILVKHVADLKEPVVCKIPSASSWSVLGVSMA